MLAVTPTGPSRGTGPVQLGWPAALTALTALATLAVIGVVAVVVAAGGEAPTATAPVSFGVDAAGLATWTRGAGDWSISDGTVRVAHDRRRPIAAYRDVGTTDLSASVTLPTPVVGAGLAFRVVDDRNFWLWSPALAPGSFTLVHVEDAFPRVVASSMANPDASGAAVTISIHAAGPRLELLVDGNVVLIATDDHPAGAGAGLGVRAVTRTVATFTDLVITPDPTS